MKIRTHATGDGRYYFSTEDEDGGAGPNSPLFASRKEVRAEAKKYAKGYGDSVDVEVDTSGDGDPE